MAKATGTKAAGATGNGSGPSYLTGTLMIERIIALLETTPANAAGQRIGFIAIGPVEARALQEKMSVKQRNLRASNLNRLVAGMTEPDGYLNNNIIWITATPDKEYQLVNGQHTLEAVVQTGTRHELPVVIDPVMDAKQVERRYSLFDIGASRTQADILKMMTMVININDEDDGGPPTIASSRALKKGAEAITWISTALASNNSGWTKFARADALRNEWRPEFAWFWRTLGDRRNPELSDEDSERWATFYDAVSGGTFQGPFMVSRRAYPEETQAVLEGLCDIARHGSDPDMDAPGLQELFDIIVGDTSSYYGAKRAILVWRVCLYLRLARQKDATGPREEKRLTKQFHHGYIPHQQSWSLASGDKLPKPTANQHPADLKAANDRKANAGRQAEASQAAA